MSYNKMFSGLKSGNDGGYNPQTRWWATPDELVEKIRNDEKLKRKTLDYRSVREQLKKCEAKMKELQDRDDDDPEKTEAINEYKIVDKKCKDQKSEKFELVTIHAIFNQGRKNEDPHEYNNLILADIDHISDEDADKLLKEVEKRPYVLFANKSVSGEGVHIVVYVDVEGGINDENFKDVFAVTTQFVDYDLNIETDKAVGSISRCMFLNHDENIYYNPNAVPLDVTGALWLKKNFINKNIIDKEMNEQESLSKYLDAADCDLIWTVGSRHTTLVSLASTCNKAGFSEIDLIDECCRRYSQSSFPDEEIRETISDVYNRYSSDHGINRKTEYVPKKDKRTKGQIDTSKETEKEFLDPEEELKARCPDVRDVQKYIPDGFFDYMIDLEKSELIRFVELMGFLVSAGAMMQDVECRMNRKEVARTYLYFLLHGPAASGKGCILEAYKFFKIYANVIQNESSEEVRKGKEAHKTWEKCVSKCKEEDCGCEAEPVVPCEKKLSLSLNTSASKLISQLCDNGDFPVLVYDSELDAIMNMKDNPVGWMYRCGWECEPVGSNTHLHGYREKEKPKIAILAAGTESQVPRLLTNKDDGLTSRMLSVMLPETPYVPLPETDDFDYAAYERREEAYKGRVKTFARYAMNTKIYFKLTQAALKRINDYFREAELRCARYGSEAVNSFLRRLRKNDIMIAQILAFFDLYNQNKEAGVYYIPDEIVEIVLSWNDFFVEQHIRLLDKFPELEENQGGSEFKYLQIFKQLPCVFDKKVAIDLFQHIAEKSYKTAFRTLKKWENKSLLVKKGGNYHKVNCPDCPQVP